ncbi:MAG: carboxypeptidase regulatory-like domain-containing protein [Candidatus Brocadiales bacterium]
MLNRVSLAFMAMMLGVWTLGLVSMPSAQGGGYEEIEVTDGGSISGVVKLAGDIPAPEEINIDKDQEVCAVHSPKYYEKLIVDKGSKGIKNAVIYLHKVKKGKKWSEADVSAEDKKRMAERHFTLGQKECTFSPHVQVIPAGSSVELENGDPLMHNLHSFAMKNSSFNESIPGGGQPVAKEFPFREVVKIGCDVHKWMTSWIVVRDNPYFCQTGADGSYKITNIPPGEYKLRIWHEAFKKGDLKKHKQKVKVEAKKETKLDFEL